MNKTLKKFFRLLKEVGAYNNYIFNVTHSTYHGYKNAKDFFLAHGQRNLLVAHSTGQEPNKVEHTGNICIDNALANGLGQISLKTN